ncbi:MAG: hypothetical protein NC336_04495 [Clostridium sp.]|nr:hypothetical protein [Clostridium sp.]
MIEQDFNKYWKKFADQFRGTLMTMARRQPLKFPVVKLVFEDTKGCWESDIHAEGRWLKKLEGENPRLAGQIRGILCDDMKLTEVETPKGGGSAVNWVLPVCAGGVGFGIAKIWFNTTLGMTLWTALPLLAAIPVARAISGSKQSDLSDSVIDQYTAQLDKYRDAVRSVITTEAFV